MPIGGYCVVDALLSSAARTASGQSNTRNVGEFSRLTYYLDVTAVSGSNSPTMVVKVQESPDESEYFDCENEVTITEAGNYRLTTEEHSKYARLYYTISGTTPSFTFSVKLAMRY